MNFMKQDEVKRLRRQYPPGTKIKCIHMNDDCHPVPDGTLGTVQFVDDAGTIHVSWGNGSSLGLIPNEDSFIKLGQLTKKKSKENVR